jgi:hypothetical protein
MLNRSLIAISLLSILAMPADARRHKQNAQSTAGQSAAAPVQVGPAPDDVAKFLAGMPVSKNSAIAGLTQDAAWQSHSQFFEQGFAKLNRTKLQKLREWQNQYLPESKEQVPVVYYMFSGPDFLFVDQFFPNASVYIMCGKEAIGPPPDPTRVTDMNSALGNLRYAMKDALRTTYFITQDMKVGLESQQFRGVLPILYVFLARADKSIREVSFTGHNSVRISFRDNHSGREQTLFYFTTDLSDGGIASNPGFMNFCHQHGVGYSFLKAPSYLMFEEGFSRVREFILNHSSLIVQDDSGIPLRYFNRGKWNVRVFGAYVGPISMFKQHSQSDLAHLYETTNPPPFGVGFGYQWDYRKSNLIVAQRSQ